MVRVEVEDGEEGFNWAGNTTRPIKQSPKASKWNEATQILTNNNIFIPIRVLIRSKY